MEFIKEIKIAVTALIGLLSGIWGWMGWLTVGWIGCMMLDYITGSAAAGKSGSWSSAKAREGIWHKIGMVVVVIVAAASDLLISVILSHLPIVQLPIEYSGLICPVVLVWYIITELGSMIENAVKMGAPVPTWLVKMLDISQHVVDAAGDSIMEHIEPENKATNGKE